MSLKRPKGNRLTMEKLALSAAVMGSPFALTILQLPERQREEASR
jgi:hypothetical protein